MKTIKTNNHADSTTTNTALSSPKTIAGDNYVPQPIDTTEVTLPPELEALSEDIARNVHDVWSKNRMQEGWTYGPERSDKLRQTPCLVPYERLSEEEKAYDRNTAQETLKLIYKLGFKITKND